MEFLKKMLKSLVIGSLVGLGIVLFTNFFFQDLIDRFENLTYYMRYRWEYSDLDNIKDESKVLGDAGIAIIDIDERSVDKEKLGNYWNWDRSYHAQLIEAVNKNFPAALVFDINFYDPEDEKQRERLQRLLARSQQTHPTSCLTEPVLNTIYSAIDYDSQFVMATRNAGNVYHAIMMATKNDYSSLGFAEQVESKMSLDWHNQLNPKSAIVVPPDLRKQAFGVSNTRPIIDGIFPGLAQAARNIGYVNMTPNEDGVIREIPLLYAFGPHPPVYLPISLRTVVTLYGTPDEEIVLAPGKYIDIGRPFKIFKDGGGALRCSYPNVTDVQVRALLERKDDILALEEGKAVEVSAFTKVGRNEDGTMYVESHAGAVPFEVLETIRTAGLDKAWGTAVGEQADYDGGISLRRDSDLDWVVTAPMGDGEWWLSKPDLESMFKATIEAFADVENGKAKLLLHTMRVRRSKGELVSSIPVLRGQTLRELCETPWEKIAGLAPGLRMDFGRTVKIPLSKDNNHIITFFGPGKKTFPTYSFYDIMKNRVQGELDGKIYVIGSTIPSMFDIVHVPHDRNYPGVEIHASLIAAFITNTFVTRMSQWQDFAVLLLVGIIIGFIAYMLKPLPGSILTVLSVFAYFLIAMTLFGSGRLWIPIVRPILTILLTYTAVMAYRYVTEEKDRKFLQSTFKQYLSPDLIDIMYKNKQMPMLGGEEGIRTAYFTDIQGFSTFSEKLGSPTRLVDLLNEYLTVMTDTLMAHYGTLDKYEGDAIIAFFGAPMKMDDHARQACQTALDMQAALGGLRQKWSGEGDKWPKIVHEMRMRIGVNSGPLVTGNMGSRMRMNYTMMGDTVNLAARLESASKQYGVYSMISQMTLDLVAEFFETRQVDKIRVVGKSEPVVVHELMAKKGELAPEIVEMRTIYNQGLALFYQQKWDEAVEVLTKSELMEPFRAIAPKGMSPSKKIIEYCTDYKKQPPPADWDGVISLTSK